MSFIDKLFGKTEEVVENKQETALRELMERIDAIKESSENEIRSLKSKKDDKYVSLGKEVYELVKAEKISLESNEAKGLIKEISELQEKTEEEKGKIDGIIARYDEEINILKRSIEQDKIQQQKVCSECQHGNPSDSAFCEQCGNKLDQ